MRKIIGIIGPIASGKDEAAKYISSRLGKPYFVISDILREVAAERGVESTRDNLIYLGNKMTVEFGADFLARRLAEKLPDGGIAVGMRMTEQIEYFRANSDFILIAIYAEAAVRFERARSRGRIGEAETLESFVRAEDAENRLPNTQRLFECMKMADYKIFNNQGLDKLYRKLNQVLVLKDYI